MVDFGIFENHHMKGRILNWMNTCNQSLNPFEWTLKLRDHKTAAPQI